MSKLLFKNRFQLSALVQSAKYIRPNECTCDKFIQIAYSPHVNKVYYAVSTHFSDLISYNIIVKIYTIS